MERLDVVFGLHFYQPPTQRPEVLERITRECYEPLTGIIAETKGHFVIDIAASLIAQLNWHNYSIIRSLQKLCEEKILSLANTAAYHPILPLVPEKFARHQLELNEDFYRGYGFLSSGDRCRGVFPPEMAVSPSLFSLFNKFGYRWTVADGVPFSTIYKEAAPVDWIPIQEGVACLLRSRSWSNIIGFGMPDGAVFARDLWNEFSHRFREKDRAYLVLWMDAETFGHHHQNAFERFLRPFLDAIKSYPISLVSPDSLLSLYPKKGINIPPGSWSTSPQELLANIPYPLWKHPDNPWHQKWWELAALVLAIAESHPEIRWLCNRALYSCQTWWVAVNGSKELFLWAIPYFEEIIRAGTAAQQELGKNLLLQLQS